MEILERNGIKIPTTDHRVGSNKRRKSENFVEEKSLVLLSPFHQSLVHDMIVLGVRCLG